MQANMVIVVFQGQVSNSIMLGMTYEGNVKKEVTLGHIWNTTKMERSG